MTETDTTTTTFKRRCRVGKWREEYGDTTYFYALVVDVEVDKDGELHVMGDTRCTSHPASGGGGGGQNRDDLNLVTTFDGVFTREQAARIGELWERWHLNHMHAGCEHQRSAGWNERPIDPDKPLDTYGRHFDGQRSDTWNMLVWVRPDEHQDGLLTAPCPECGYRYGTAWVREELPAAIVTELEELTRKGVTL